MIKVEALQRLLRSKLAKDDAVQDLLEKVEKALVAGIEEVPPATSVTVEADSQKFEKEITRIYVLEALAKAGYYETQWIQEQDEKLKLRVSYSL